MTHPRLTTLWARADRRLRHRDTDGSESGLTLTELLVASTVLIILLTISLVAVQSYLSLSTQVLSSYGNSEQVVLVGTNFQKLVRNQVSPAPTPTTGANANIPSPPFSTVAGSDTGLYTGSAAVGTFSTTFYANTGNAAGPVQVVATERANPASGRFKTWTFTVTEQVPDAGTCPFSVSSTNVCTYKDLSNNPAKAIFSVPDVVNNDTPTTVYAGTPQATALSYTPIFTYILLQTSPAAGNPGQEVPVSVVTPNTLPSPNLPTGFFWPLSEARNDDSIFQTCTATKTGTPIANTCPGDAVQGVTIDLLIQSPGSSTPAEDDTTIFSLSSTSNLYNPLVG
jgi:hypothetical protein